MAEILLFHHAQGLTEGVLAFAERLRAAGHTVHTPDSFEGRSFATVDEGVAHAREVGFDVVGGRALAAAEGLPDALVYAGFSLGVMPAQELAQTRPGARGALLFHGAAPVEEWGGWPDGVPVQVHGMDKDPWFEGEDLDAARGVVGAADHGELFLYPGDQHLFADESLDSYDAEAAELLLERVLAFLADA